MGKKREGCALCGVIAVLMRKEGVLSLSTAPACAVTQKGVLGSSKYFLLSPVKVKWIAVT